jgi:hypothetical protein
MDVGGNKRVALAPSTIYEKLLLEDAFDMWVPCKTKTNPLNPNPKP